MRVLVSGTREPDARGLCPLTCCESTGSVGITAEEAADEIAEVAVLLVTPEVSIMTPEYTDGFRTGAVGLAPTKPERHVFGRQDQTRRLSTSTTKCVAFIRS